MASSRATHSQTVTGWPGRLPGEEGFGLIELLVAIVLVLIGVLSALTAFEASQRSNGHGERNASVAQRSQSELERILALPYAEVGMASTPANSGSGNPDDPLNYVTTGPAGYEYDWAVPSKHEPFVTGGTLATSSAWTDGNLSGTLYRFVTWVADPCAACAKAEDYKRVTIVLTTPGTSKPFTNSTIITK
jgi:type II secretory pathway pseudopilin PulG